MANKLMIVGLGLLALAMSGVVLLITDVLFGTTATIVATGITVGTFTILWYAIPLWRRMRLRRAQS